jgi:hypothetical protein
MRALRELDGTASSGAGALQAIRPAWRRAYLGLPDPGGADLSDLEATRKTQRAG